MQRQKRPTTTETRRTRSPAERDPKNLTIGEFAAEENISSPMTRKMIRIGVPVHIGDGHTEIVKLPAFSVGKKVLIPREAGAAFMARLRNAPPRPIRRKTAAAA